jgi:surface protein
MKKILFILAAVVLNSCELMPDDGATTKTFSEVFGECSRVTFYVDKNHNNVMDNDDYITDVVELCNGQTGAQGERGEQGYSVVIETTFPSSTCKLLTFFRDENINGIKDDGELIISSSTICDGNSIQVIATSATSCTNGGMSYSFYQDINANGAKDSNEAIINTTVICNGNDGADGTDGTDGSDGADAEITVIVNVRAATISECFAGGFVFETTLADIVLETEIECNAFDAFTVTSEGTIIAKDELISGSEYLLDGVSYLVVANNFELKSAYNSGRDMSTVVTTRVIDMSELFSGKQSFNDDISSWDVSNVKYAIRLFRNATEFNQDISAWDISNIKEFYAFFAGAAAFNQDISGWDVSNATDMRYMFQGATSFDQDLSGWDVSNVEFYDYFANLTTIDWLKPLFE